MKTNQPSGNQNRTETEVQPRQASSNSRKLFVVATISVLLTAMITGSAVYFWQKSANEKVVNDLREEITTLKNQVSRAETVEKTSQPTSPPALSSMPATIQPDSLETYLFSDFNLSFDYPEQVLLKEVDRVDGFVVTLYSNGSTMTIKPNQVGLGFENSDIEITQTPLTINGEQLRLAGSPIKKTKLVNKVKNETSYLIIVPYPDQRNYSIMITYSFEDGIVDANANQLFDQILSSFKFTK